MPIFKPEDLNDAKSVSFSAQDLQDATPVSSVQDMMRTSTPTPAQTARDRMAGRTISPELTKMNPPTATQWQGPFGDYGENFNPPKEVGGGFGGGFGQSFKDTWNTIRHPKESVDQMFSAHGEENPLLALIKMEYGPMAAPVTAPIDTWKESSKRGAANVSTKDLLGNVTGQAAQFGIGEGLARGPRALLPADIAGEQARKIVRSTIGTKPENFAHGATPDVAPLQDLKGGLVTRSEGRLLKKIKATKGAELDALEKDVSVPGHETNFSDPMESIQPVIDDAISRAVPTEKTRIAEFQSLLSNKINSLSNGSMKLNPQQIVQLKRWVDGFVGVYRDEPTGTLRDLAQNTYSAVREHLNKVAPEATVRGQRIQSLIQDEEALHNKIYAGSTEPHGLGMWAKNAISSVMPTTLGKTSAAALFKLLSGGEFDKPMLPTNLGSPDFTTMEPPQKQITSASRFQVLPQGLLPAPSGPVPSPSDFTVSPTGSTIPSSGIDSGMLPGVPQRLQGPPSIPAHEMGAPTQVDPYNTAINAGQEYLGELKSGAKASGSPEAIERRASAKRALSDKPWEDKPFPPMKKSAPKAESPLGSLPPVETPTQEHARLIEKRNQIIKEAVDKEDNPNLVLKDEAAKRKAADIAAGKLPMPDKPTHITEGSQVSGMDTDGNLISGKLDKIYPVIEDGKPIWKGVIIDARNSRTVDMPADRLFDRLAGPPKPTKASVKTETPKPVTTTESVADDKAARSKKAMQDYLDKMELRQLEQEHGVGPKKKGPKKP